MQYNGLPVFNIVLDDTDNEFEGLSVVSIVDQPAVCEQLYCFSKEEKKQYIFADETNEKHCITSVALLADCPIYRYSPDMGEYYVVFQKQTIRDLVEKYSKDGYNNLVSFQHNGEIVNDFIMLESYFVDKENGLAPSQFDVPDGSWIVTYKCTNNETWEMVKNELSTGGYSVEINCSIEPANDDQIIFNEPESENDDELDDEEFMNWLDELLKVLEDEDCEVLFDSDKDKWLVNGDGEYWLDENGNKVPAKCPKCGADVGVYIKGEPVYLCSECGEYLGTVKFPDDEMFSVEVKKKSEFKVDRADVLKQIKKAVKVDGTDYWVYGIGKRDGENVAILYNPETKEYDVKKLDEIKKWVPLKDKPGTFPALPDRIVDDPQITVQKTIISNEIPDIMHSHILAQLSYNDEQPNPHAGFRQVAIVAHGLTKAGNKCFRAYELFGDSRSAAEGEAEIPGWRLFLESRVVSLKSMTGTQPYTKEWLGGLSPKYNWQGDKSMEPCTDHLTEADFLN